MEAQAALSLKPVLALEGQGGSNKDLRPGRTDAQRQAALPRL